MAKIGGESRRASSFICRGGTGPRQGLTAGQAAKQPNPEPRNRHERRLAAKARRLVCDAQ